jgi:hypothetical protein
MDPRYIAGLQRIDNAIVAKARHAGVLLDTTPYTGLPFTRGTHLAGLHSR